MKLPLSWLAEFVTVEAPLEQLCARLTGAGLEVESIDHIAQTFTDVFVAKVLAVERHPNADRLNLCDVDAGAAGRFRVVCGAPNARAGMTAALAKVGSRLAAGAHGAGSGSLENATPLQAAVIRGVPSEGMLCSEMELGMSKDHEGILELPSDAKAGEPLASYLHLPDVVLDIAITPNRGDCLSIRGLAREVAALFELKLKVPRYRSAKVAVAGDATLTVDLRAPELCPRYAAIALDGIKIGPSPIWLRRRLELCGMRALNNVVDVTNYVMLELGQPLHAFDAARVANRAIIVRRTADDREFITLDDGSRALEPGDLLIADGEKPLAIAGVMGGQNSEVEAATTAIILESAYFEPSAIARTARRLGLRSEASYRFERGVDRDGQIRAACRAADLIREVAGGRELSPPIDVQPHPAPPREINFNLAALTSLLGVAIPPAVVKHRLRAVGATVSSAGRDRWKVTAPTFRPDLNEPADLAEEVARLSGLAEIPAILPARTAAVAIPDASRTLRRKIRDVLIGCGLVEAKTIAFVAPSDNERFPGFHMAEAVRVTNPLSAELSEMRTSLIPGLLGALRFNLNREATAFHVFELGKVFGSREGVAEEFERIAAVSYGDFAMGAIGRPAVAANFGSLKGLLETTLATLSAAGGIDFEHIPQGFAPYLHPGQSAMIKLAGKLCGVVGELHPAESLKLDLQLPCVLFEVDLAQLLAYGSSSRKKVTAPSRYPAVRRDVALVVDRDLPAGNVTAVIAGLHPALLESAELFDVYEGGTLPAGKKSVAVACKYRGKDGTLTDDEVNRAHAALVEQLAAQLGAGLRQ
ncbi:MAG TPA: phenylalanine--tRNA ligase subunit beta [Candidatus Binataceae bacterium]|nr:phenylalanine--tRNA ligase subunit beta [Candidatus Binataceae bacterium]